MSANRTQTYHDFGYVALDILSVRGDDAGTYTVVARNALGEAKLSASMKVESKISLYILKSWPLAPTFEKITGQTDRSVENLINSSFRTKTTGSKIDKLPETNHFALWVS